MAHHKSTIAKDYKGMLRSTLGLDPSMDYLVEDDASSSSTTGSNNAKSADSSSKDSLSLQGTGTLSTTSNSSEELESLFIEVKEPPTPKEATGTSPCSTATTVTASSNQSNAGPVPLPSPLLQEWRSRFRRATQQHVQQHQSVTPKQQGQQQFKTPKSVRFASPSKSPTAGRLATPSPSQIQMTPPPTTPASYLSWIGGDSPTRSPMLLSPDHFQEISQRNRVLQSAWHEQKEQTRTLANQLELLQKKYSPEPEIDKRCRQLQVQHAQEIANLKRNHKLELQTIEVEYATKQQIQKKYDELEHTHFKTKEQLHELQQSYDETCAELEWHHQAHKETKEELERSRQRHIELQQKHKDEMEEARIQFKELQEREQSVEDGEKAKQALDRLEEAQSQIEHLQRQLYFATKNEESIRSANNELLEKLEDAHSQIEYLQDELDGMRDEAEKKVVNEAVQDENLQELEKARAKIDQLHDELNAMQVEAAKFNLHAVERARNEIDELQAELDASSLEAAKKRELDNTILNETFKELAVARATIEHLQDEQDVMRKGSAKKVELHQDVQNEMLQQLEVARTEMEQMKVELDSMRTVTAKKEWDEDVYNKNMDELENARFQIEELHEVLENTRQQAAELEEIQTELARELEDALQRNYDQACELEQTQRSCDEMQRLYKETATEMNKFASQIVEMDHLQRETAAEMERLNNENRELQNTIQQHTSSIQEWQRRFESLDEKLHTKEDNRQKSPFISSHVANLQRKHAVELDEMQRQMMDATMQLHTTLSNYSTSSSLDLTLSQVEMNDTKHDAVFFVTSPNQFIPDNSEFATLSPIVPLPVATPESSDHDDQSLPNDVETIYSAPPTPRIDDLIDELGEMDHERTLLLDQLGQYHSTSQEVKEKDNRNTDDSSTSMLDATIDLLQKMKDLITSPPPISSPDGIVLDEKETSVLEQLEVLSEMMGYNDGDESLTLQPNRSLLSTLDEHGELSLSKEAPLDESIVEEDTMVVDKSQDLVPVWADLVAELRRHIVFLENDRREVVRTTQFCLDEERRIEKLKIDAATAQAHREGYEKAERRARDNFQLLFAKRLCHTCREQIQTCQ